jgi:hypothetical protein
MQLSARLGRSLLVALLFAVLVPLAAQAYFDGIAKTNGCGGCHGNKATGSLGVSVVGPTELLAGETATYTLTVDAMGAGGAFSVDSSNGGSFVTSIEANTLQVNGNVSHANALAGAPGGNLGDWSYNFDLTAGPLLPGSTITLSFAGMAFNGDGNDTNADIWNTGSFLVSVVPEPATGLLVGLGIGMLALAGRRRNA